MAVLEITEENYEEEIIHSDTLVLVYCWKPKSFPCRKMTPIIEEVAQEFEGRLKVAALNAKEQKELGDEVFKSVSVPMVMIVKEGMVTNLCFDIHNKKQILLMLSQHFEDIRI